MLSKLCSLLLLQLESDALRLEFCKNVIGSCRQQRKYCEGTVFLVLLETAPEAGDCRSACTLSSWRESLLLSSYAITAHAFSRSRDLSQNVLRSYIADANHPEANRERSAVPPYPASNTVHDCASELHSHTGAVLEIGEER